MLIDKGGSPEDAADEFEHLAIVTGASCVAVQLLLQTGRPDDEDPEPAPDPNTDPRSRPEGTCHCPIRAAVGPENRGARVTSPRRGAPLRSRRSSFARATRVSGLTSTGEGTSRLSPRQERKISCWRATSSGLMSHPFQDSGFGPFDAVAVGTGTRSLDRRDAMTTANNNETATIDNNDIQNDFMPARWPRPPARRLFPGRRPPRRPLSPEPRRRSARFRPASNDLSSPGDRSSAEMLFVEHFGRVVTHVRGAA